MIGRNDWGKVICLSGSMSFNGRVWRISIQSFESHRPLAYLVLLIASAIICIRRNSQGNVSFNAVTQIGEIFISPTDRVAAYIQNQEQKQD